MLAYLAKRLLWTFGMLIGVSALVFLTMHLAPGDPAHLVAGMDAPPETIELIRKDLGLDQPILVQFKNFLVRVVQGDFGRSLHSNTKVSDQLIARFPVTLKLAAFSMALAIPLGLILGVVSATRRGTWTDRLTMVLAMTGTSLPIFWLGLLLLWAFSVQIGWFPVGGDGGLRHYVLPAIALGTGPLGLIARLVRSSLLDVFEENYIRTARSKGLRESIVIYRHALRNALLTVVTAISVQLGSLLAGSVVTETVFSLHGLGEMMVRGIINRDFPLVQAPLLVIAISFMLINLLTDVLYTIIDPRIRFA